MREPLISISSKKSKKGIGKKNGPCSVKGRNVAPWKNEAVRRWGKEIGKGGGEKIKEIKEID